MTETPQQPQMPPEPIAVDPFAEKFDEEEIVLDSFAAWDQIFHDQVPRVENRRDPGFATLVQAALDATPAFTRPALSPAFKIVPSHANLKASPRQVGAVPAFENESGEGWDSAFFSRRRFRRRKLVSLAKRTVPAIAVSRCVRHRASRT